MLGQGGRGRGHHRLGGCQLKLQQGGQRQQGAVIKDRLNWELTKIFLSIEAIILYITLDYLS